MKKEVLALGISAMLSLAYGAECEYYKVQKGDTLWDIAKKKGVSVDAIISSNKNLDTKRIRAGEKICIPAKKGKQQYTEYTVKKGDTLEKISKKFHVSVKELVEFNNLKSEHVLEGQKIKIPHKKFVKGEKAEESYSYYTVQKGARLKDISKKLGVPLGELESLNPEYKGKFLSKGTKVKIPKMEAGKEKEAVKEEGGYEFYTVERGGKLEHISKKLGIPLKTLEKLNPEYKGVWLKKGTKIKIPEQEEVKHEYEIYTIKRGGRLKDVSKMLGVPLKELEKLNPELKGKFLSKGTKIKVPKMEAKKPSVHYVKHKVRRGETLRSIAERYGVSEKEIMKANHLKSGKLIAGKVINIPVEGKPALVKEEKSPENSGRSMANLPEEKETQSTELKISKGSIPMPVDGKMVKSTRGVDILADCGQPIKSVDDGKVIYSGGDLQAYGNMVIVEHKDFISLYAYNSKNLVKRGDSVSKGQEIATVGNKNNSQECMLHFELRTKDGVPLDPTEYLKNTQ